MTSVEQYEALSLLLPRFIRVLSSGDDVASDLVAGFERLVALFETSEEDRRVSSELARRLIYQVKWMPGFLAIPGFVKLPSGGVRALLGAGLYAMDAASAMAIAALRLPQQQLNKQSGSIATEPQVEEFRVLDLCCCPGAKLALLRDRLRGNRSCARHCHIIGVDINHTRLSVCKSLLLQTMAYQDLEAVNIAAAATKKVPLVCSCFSIVQWLCSKRRSSLDRPTDARLRAKRSLEQQLQPKLSVKARENESNLFFTRSNKSTRARQVRRLRELQDEMASRNGSEGFDRVLVDAECSHDGSYRHMRYQGSLERAGKVVQLHTGGAELRDLQRNLLFNGYKLCKPGGIVVYSTCSLEEEQNERIVQWLLRQPGAAHAELLDPNVDFQSTDSATAEENWGDHTQNSCKDTPVDVQMLLDLPLPALYAWLQANYRFNPQDSKESILEKVSGVSSQICQYVCASAKVPMQKKSIPEGPVGLMSTTGGTSGLFIAVLKKPS
eukprot:GSChrysophyteH1.ASY1.ANO1.2140.1 assembled CDS